MLNKPQIGEVEGDSGRGDQKKPPIAHKRRTPIKAGGHRKKQMTKKRA